MRAIENNHKKAKLYVAVLKCSSVQTWKSDKISPGKILEIWLGKEQVKIDVQKNYVKFSD